MHMCALSRSHSLSLRVRVEQLFDWLQSYSLWAFPTNNKHNKRRELRFAHSAGHKNNYTKLIKGTLPCCSACQVSLPICLQHVRVERRLRHSLRCRGAHTSSYSSCVALTKPELIRRRTKRRAKHIRSCGSSEQGTTRACFGHMRSATRSPHS